MDSIEKIHADVAAYDKMKQAEHDEYMKARGMVTGMVFPLKVEETGVASPPPIQDPHTEPLDARMRVDVNRASEVTPAVDRAIDDMFEYHPWDAQQTQDGVQVRLVLAAAARVIVERVPPSPDRSAAIRKLREARMDCNSAITHNGRF